MTVSALISTLVRQHLKGATAAVAYDRDGRYVVTVTAPWFDRVKPAERPQRVYEALAELPAEVLARVGDIQCLVGFREG